MHITTLGIDVVLAELDRVVERCGSLCSTRICADRLTLRFPLSTANQDYLKQQLAEPQGAEWLV